MKLSTTAVTALIALVPAYVSAAAIAKRALLTGQWDTESEVRTQVPMLPPHLSGSHSLLLTVFGVSRF